MSKEARDQYFFIMGCILSSPRLLIYSSVESSHPLVCGLNLCGIESSNELVNTGLYICGPDTV